MKKPYIYYFAVIPSSGNLLTTGIDSGTRLTGALQNANMAEFINVAFETTLVVGAILAVARITWGGFIYMTKDSFPSKMDAKKIITDAVIGLVLLMSIWLILRQINPDILKLDFVVPNTSTGGAVQSAPTNNTSVFGSGAAPAPALQ